MPSNFRFSTVLHKRSSVAGAIPTSASLSAGELVMNVHDGKLFIKTVEEQIKTFSDDSQSAFTLDPVLSGVKPQHDGNTINQVFANVLGGYNNNISGAGSTIINGEGNDIGGDLAFIGSGTNNKINAGADYSAILGGQNNLVSHQNSFTIGSNLSSHAENFTYVNNISGTFWGDGTNIKNLNWDSTFTNVQSNSANWQTAYAYVSANSVNLTATNIFVNNNVTVTNTVSAKYYQGTLLDWMTLVRGYKTTPTLLQTLVGGEVYTYVYATTGTDKTYYRYIATDGSEDSFYGNFVNPTLSNLIATKSIIL